jgi:putative endonuclease
MTPTPVSTRDRGARWELTAESFLQSRGLKTVCRNFNCRAGEIDLVMLDGRTLVFTEVRYRRDNRHGSGADSVTPAKQRRITHAAKRFLQKERQHAYRPCRFDVISIGMEEGRTVMNWVRWAFEAT